MRCAWWVLVAVLGLADEGGAQSVASMPLTRGTLAFDERTNVLIARDVAGNLNQIEELIRSLDTQTPQVLIEARVVEATSRYIRDAGIQWGGDASFSAATGNPTGLAFPSSVGVVGGASDAQTPTGGLSPFSNTISNPNFAVNLPAVVGTGAAGHGCGTFDLKKSDSSSSSLSGGWVVWLMVPFLARPGGRG